MHGLVHVALHTAEEMAEDVVLHLGAETVEVLVRWTNSILRSVLGIPKPLPLTPTPRVAKCR